MAMLNARPAARRLAWRAGRRLYRDARGEGRNDLAQNGETYVQACVLGGSAPGVPALTVFDVGANRGAWTQAFLDQLSESQMAKVRLFAFEPIPATRARLEEAVARMRGRRIVEVLPLAMSDQRRTAEMLVLSESGGTNTLEFDAAMGAGARGRVTVETTTLDHFCSSRGIDRVNLLKCDAEGHDSHIIKGALPLLASGRIDVLQFEYNHRWIYARAFLKDVFDLADGLPYRVARIRPHHVEVFEAWHPELDRFFEANYLLVHEPALAWFDARFGRFDTSNTYA